MQVSAELTTFVKNIFKIYIMKYKHLTLAQRYVIASLYAKNFSLTAIAGDPNVNVSVGTVSREIKRNFSKRKYSALLAQEWADIRKKRLLHNNRAISHKIKTRVLNLLVTEQWSPVQISGYLRTEGIKVSHETIYKWIRADKKTGGWQSFR